MAADCPAETLGRFPAKDPGDVLDYLFDFTNLLDSAEQITALNAVTVEPSGVLTVDSSGIVTGGKKIQVVLSSGTAGVDYVVSVNVTTDNATPRTFERSGIVPVEEQ